MIYANATLITHLLSLYYNIASRVPVATQEELIIPDLEQFFARFHTFYDDANEKQMGIYSSILLEVKKRVVFSKQRIDPSLSLYSFQLLELLKGRRRLLLSCVETNGVPASIPAKSKSCLFLTSSSHLPPPAEFKSATSKNRADFCHWIMSSDATMLVRRQQHSHVRRQCGLFE